MKTIKLISISIILLSLNASAAVEAPLKSARTQEEQEALTPDSALKKLQDGNNRFVENRMLKRNLAKQAKSSAQGQFPFAVVLGCMDSRGSTELIFDQGIGDIFAIRVAGNVLNEDNLGSLEFATQVAGAKIIVVLGHTACGAVQGACNKVELGNLTQLLSKIDPSWVLKKHPERTCEQAETVDLIAADNVKRVVKQISQRSTIIAELLKTKKIIIVGAMHDISTGSVRFY